MIYERTRETSALAKCSCGDSTKHKKFSNSSCDDSVFLKQKFANRSWDGLALAPSNLFG